MEKWIAWTTGGIGSIISLLIDGMGLAVTILIAIMGIDYVTGLMQAWYNKQLSSMVGMRGFIRKLYVLLLIAAIYLCEDAIFGTEHVGDGVVIAYIAIELISITENGIKMGAPMPPYIKSLIEIVKDKTKINK